MDASTERTARPNAGSNPAAEGRPDTGRGRSSDVRSNLLDAAGDTAGDAAGATPEASVAIQIRRFRLAAIAEAWSWAGLLVAMVFKYLVVQNPVGVQIMGPIHGVLFVVYLLFALQLANSLRWSTATTAAAIAAAFPPFCTVWFERWALRAGLFAARDAG
jgi:integral membrane protein